MNWFGPYRFCFPDRATAQARLPEAYQLELAAVTDSVSAIEHGEFPGTEGWHVDIKLRVPLDDAHDAREYLVLPETPSRVW